MRAYMSCTILWSTQSGRAKACARRARRVLRDNTGLELVQVGGSFDEYTLARILDTRRPTERAEQHVWVLLVSTTGDGEQCDTMRQTWQALLNKSLPPDLLQFESFALFALGDRAYGPQFCAGGRKLAARLVQLGASPCVSVGYGDDGTPNGGVFADFDEWLNTVLVPAMPKRIARDGTDDGEDERAARQRDEDSMSGSCVVQFVKSNGDTVLPSKMEEWRQSCFRSDYQQYFSSSCPITAYVYDNNLDSPTCPLEGRMLVNRRLTNPSWEQNTRHVSIQVSATRRDGTRLPYQAGDVSAIMPVNAPDSVEKLLHILPASIQSLADCEMKVLQTNSQTRCQWPRRCTLRGLLTYCADIQALPEREDLYELSFLCDLNHTMGPDQRDKLMSLSDPSGTALYADYVLREKRTWADVLFDFDSVTMTLDALLRLLQPMRPREFSIASAPRVSSKEGMFDVELCIAVVEGTTPLGRTFQGLCSTYLAHTEVSCSVQMWIRPGSFGKLPLALNDKGQFSTPVLCIGAGTGIAPLRSILLEREGVRSEHLKSTGAALHNDEFDNFLVFGCRHKAMDYYYEDEWNILVDDKRLFLWTAFSRDQWHKVYVQQVARDANDGTLIVDHLLKKQGAIYIAGGAKMARCVKDELIECLTKEVGEKQATLFLKRLNRLGKYSVEAWS